MLTRKQLQQAYPEYFSPIYCENGCGVIIDLLYALDSYKRGGNGQPLAICECCASEDGHLGEANERPEEAPVCRCNRRQ